MTETVALRAEAVSVAFDGVPVLRDVTLDVFQGEIHGLIGENGAGKSTLGKVFGGYYQATAGTVQVYGQTPAKWDPPAALAQGVAMMHQELQLVPALTVAQNVFLGLEHAWCGLLRQNEPDRLADLMASSGFVLDPHAVVADLSIADQQKIEILRAMARNARVIVMDEPTSSLSKSEVEHLHDAMRTLSNEGHSIIYVSHFLHDILAVTDRITVLRDGALVMTAPRANQTRSSLVAAMLGEGKTETPYPVKRKARSTPPVLQVNGLQSATGLHNVSLAVGQGEIVGLVGLVGSGRSEIARAIIGADLAAGSVRMHGDDYPDRTVASSARRGLVMVPEDRRKQGLVMTMTVRPNMTLPHLRRYSTGGMLASRGEAARVQRMIAHFGIRPGAVDGNVARYSGGNQQKVLLAKWLIENPDIVLLDEPSRGVDVGARERIHHAIVELAEGGTGVLLISSDIDEVLGLAHRAYLVAAGQIVNEIDTDEHTEASILAALFAHQVATAAGAAE